MKSKSASLDGDIRKNLESMNKLNVTVYPHLSLAYTVRSLPVFDLILRRMSHFEVGPTSGVTVRHLSCSKQGRVRADVLLPTHDLMIGWTSDTSEILVSCH